MKLLFDQNLSPKLMNRLADPFPGSAHVLSLGLDREDDAAAAAVVLLAEMPDRDAWEVAYLGLTPDARGRGLGLAALEHARSLAAPHVRCLELAVDRRNAPAVRLYRAAGFRRFDRRSVHLAILRR